LLLISSGDDDEEWTTIDHFHSHPGFFLDDGSGGYALTLVDGAEFILQKDLPWFSLRSSDFSEVPTLLMNALKDHQEELENFSLTEENPLMARTYAFKEKSFGSGQEIYVLGYADSGFASNKEIQKDTKSFHQSLITLLKKKYPQEQLETLFPMIKMVLKDQRYSPFIISDHEEFELKLEFGKDALIKIGGGIFFIITTIAVGYFLYTGRMQFVSL